MTTLILAAQAAQGGGGTGLLIMMVAIFAIMWFFMIRPQQKQQKKVREFQNSLTEGASVVTGGGIYGTVKRVHLAENKVEVEIARGVIITVSRNNVYADASQQPRA